MTPQQASALTAADFRRHAAELRPDTRMVIDGELLDARSGRRFETANPANGEIIAAVPLGDATEVDLAVASARRSFRAGTWSRLEPRARMAVLYRFTAPRG